MYSDTPINTKYEDELNRYNFVKRLGDAILKYNKDESLVISLYGEWGSGKSSIINMTCEYLFQQDLWKNIKVIKFNPWNISNQNDLISEFFKELSEFLNKYDFYNTNRLKRKGYIKRLTQSDIGFNIRGVNIRANFNKNNSNETLHELKNKIEEEILLLDFKILIIIDDIDRLNDNEINEIFRLIKSIADFPNTIYLLTYDKKVVEDALKRKYDNGLNNEFSAEKYLEKIVQVPIDMPKFSYSELRSFLLKKIDDILLEEYEKDMWSEVILYFKPYINNIRDINRYCNTLEFVFPIIGKDINISDLVLITLLNVFEHDVYIEISKNKEFFTYNNDIFYNSLHKFTEDDKKFYETILKKSFSQKKENIGNLLKFLFPKLLNIYEKDSNYNIHIDHLRIGNENYFNNYFILNIPPDEISVNEIEKLLDKTNISGFKENLTKMNRNEKEKIPNLIEQLEYHITNIESYDICYILNPLMDMGDKLSENGKNINKNLHYFMIFNKLLLKVENPKKRFEILLDSIIQTENSICTYVYFLYYTKHVYENEIEKEFRHKLAIPQENINQLKDLISDKIFLIPPKKLILNKNVNNILVCLKEWNTEEKFNNYINNFFNEIDNSDLQVYGTKIESIKTILKLK